MSEQLSNLSEQRINLGLEAAYAANEAFDQQKPAGDHLTQLLKVQDIEGVSIDTEVRDRLGAEILSARRDFYDYSEVVGYMIGPDVPGSDRFFGSNADNKTESDRTVETPRVNAKEYVAQQFKSAQNGYEGVVDALNFGKRKKERIETETRGEIFVAELEVWFTEDKQAYIAKAMEADPELSFTLVATPNVVVTPDVIMSAAREFGQGQPYTTYVFEELYCKYSAEQLSGTTPETQSNVVFSLIPSKFTPELEGTVEQQRAKFAELQATNPDLKVPSPLEAVTYWYTLRAQGDRLNDSTTLNKTYIRHFDLPEQRLGGWDCVPSSCVSGGGGPVLDRSNVGAVYHARVAVG